MMNSKAVKVMTAFGIGLSLIWMTQAQNTSTSAGAEQKSPATLVKNEGVLTPIPVMVDAELVEVADPKAIDKTFITGQDLRSLKPDQVRTISRLQAMTKSGVNAETKTVREMTYLQRVAGSLTNQTETLQTRDVGTILNVTPVVGHDKNTIDLTLLWQWVSFEGWSLANGSTIKYPLFSSKAVASSFTIKNNTSIAVQIQENDDISSRDLILLKEGSGQAKSRGKFYLIISVRTAD